MNETVEGLIQQMGIHSPGDARLKAEEKLLAIGKPAAPNLIETLHHQDDTVRRFSIGILEKLKEESAVPELILVLKKKGQLDWENALSALAKIGGEGAIDAIIGQFLVADSRPAVAGNASSLTDAVIKLGEPAVPRLWELLETHESPAVLWNIHRVFVEHGIPRGQGEFRTLVGIRMKREEGGKANAAFNHILGSFAAKMWGRIKADGTAGARICRERAAELVAQLEAPDYEDRYGTVMELGAIGDPSAVPALIKTLGDKKEEIGMEAAEALVKIGPRDYNDLNALITIGRKLKSEKKDFGHIVELHSEWVKIMNQRADAIINDKKFHVPKVRKPDRGTDKTERVLRVRRFCA